jgi:AcrR family transcriptional regulator
MTGTTRKLGRPADVDSTATRQRVLQVARVLFARNGYDGTTNRAIAEAADLTPGAIYHYVESKAVLYAEVYEEVQTYIYAAFEKAVVGKHTLAERFTAVLDAAVELSRTDASITGFIVGVPAEAERHPELRELIRPVRRRHSGFLGQLAREAKAHGEIADDVSPRAVEDLLAAVLGGLARLATSNLDADRHAEAVGAVKRLLGGTLVRPPR